MLAAAAKAVRGVTVLTQPDLRWARCDIKSTGLLPNVLARQAAKEQGALEAILVDDEGMVTEGAASNAWKSAGGGVSNTRDWPVTGWAKPSLAACSAWRGKSSRVWRSGVGRDRAAAGMRRR